MLNLVTLELSNRVYKNKTFALAHFSSQLSHLAIRYQCDQMARLFFQFLFTRIKVYHFDKMFSKVGLQFCQIINKPSKDWQRVFKFYQTGEFSPNLVTLFTIDRTQCIAFTMAGVSASSIQIAGRKPSIAMIRFRYKTQPN